MAPARETPPGRKSTQEGTSRQGKRRLKRSTPWSVAECEGEEGEAEDGTGETRGGSEELRGCGEREQHERRESRITATGTLKETNH